MNKKQKIVMWVAILITVGMFLYPPQNYKRHGWTRDRFSRGPLERYSYTANEYGFLISDGNINFERMIIQVVGVWLIATGFMFAPISISIKPSTKKQAMIVLKVIFFALIGLFAGWILIQLGLI